MSEKEPIPVTAVNAPDQPIPVTNVNVPGAAPQQVEVVQAPGSAPQEVKVMPSLMEKARAWSVIIGAIVIGILQIMQMRNTHETNRRMQEMKIVADDTHVMVNSAMGEQKRLSMVQSEFIAQMTKDPVHIEAAKIAKERYEEHQKQQGMVDRNHDK